MRSRLRSRELCDLNGQCFEDRPSSRTLGDVVPVLGESHYIMLRVRLFGGRCPPMGSTGGGAGAVEHLP